MKDWDEQYSRSDDYSFQQNGYDNASMQALQAIAAYPNAEGMNDFQLQIQAAIKAKKWYTEDQVDGMMNHIQQLFENYKLK